MKNIVLPLASALAVAFAWADAPTIRILPLGDSITHGAAYSTVNPTQFTGGYRAPLYDMLTEAGISVEFVGTRTQNGGSMVSPAHEGYPGYRISNWWNTGAAGIYETIWDTFTRIDNPHIILLHIGTNDSADYPDANSPIEKLNLLLDRLVAFEPGAEIVLSSLMYRTETSNWNWISNTFNPALPGIVAARRARGEKIHFLDLQNCIDGNGLSDTVHPNEAGYRLMAAKWFESVTNIVSGTWQPDDTLSVLYAVTNDSPASLSFKMNARMDATSVADVSHYAVDGAAVRSAALGSDGHTVTVSFTSPVATDVPHVLAVSGLANAVGTATLAAKSIPFEIAGRGAAAHVPAADRRGYRRIAVYDFPNRPVLTNNCEAVYSDDLRAEVGDFTRVAYYFELREAGRPLQWLWTSMDPYTHNVQMLGVPTRKSGACFDCYVSNLVIRSNVPGITPGERALGNIEFWPWNYSYGRGSFQLPNGSETLGDFDDTCSLNNGDFGSMQVHDFQNQTTLFSWSGWGGYNVPHGRGDASYPTIGFGNAPSGNPDWTWTTQNGAVVPGCSRNYDIKRMEIYVLETPRAVPAPLPVTAALTASRDVVEVTFDEPVSLTGLADAFTLGKGVRILDVTRNASNARVVTLVLDRAAEANCLFLTVKGVRGLSPLSGVIGGLGETVTVTQGNSPVSAAALAFAPRRALASSDRTRVCVSFDYAVPTAYATADRFAFAGGAATVVRAYRSPAERRDVILELAAPLAADTAYTVDVTLVDNTTRALAFRTAGALPDFLSTANIPEFADFSLVNYLDIPTSAAYSWAGAAYTVDESRFFPDMSFDRVAYCLELVQNGDRNWVWVSLDPFTADAAKIGVPTVERGILFAQYVTNLKVYSGLAGSHFTLATSGDLDEGNIEFWPSNFSYGNVRGIPGASDANFDWGDATGSLNYGWGSMQIHNYKGRETIFAFNSYGNPGGPAMAVTTEMGIGNRPNNQHTDWISAANSGDFTVRHLYVFARRTEARTDVGTGPLFLVQPANVTARAGEACRLTAFAAGATRYQWRKGGVAIPLATAGEYAFPASAAAEGTYDVLAWDEDGNVSAGGSATVALATGADPVSPAIRIMPIGDSITWGYNVNGGYRAPLYDLLVGAGWNVAFCGTETANSSGMASPCHEGHSGYVLSSATSPGKNGLLENLPTWLATAENPHVVLLHAGTNDGNSGSDALALYGLSNMSKLVDAIASSEPGAEIVVTTVLQRDWGLNGTDTANVAVTNVFNPGLPALVRQHRAKGQKVHFFDMASRLTIADTADGVHPNAAGYVKMAEAWCECLTNLIPRAGLYVPDDTPAAVNVAADHEGLSLTFNEDMANNVRDLSNITVSDPNVTVTGAAFTGGGSRALRISLDGIPPLGGTYTITLNGGSNAAWTYSLPTTAYTVEILPDPNAGTFVSDVGLYTGFRGRKEVDVAAGATLTQTNGVFQEGNSRIMKTGEGTWNLPVSAFRQKQPFDIGVRGGTLALSKGNLIPSAERPVGVVAKAALWLTTKGDDGARSLRIVVTNGLDGTEYVAKWCDERETNVATPTRIYAWPSWSAPAYTALTGVPPVLASTNGLPGVYFGGYTSGKCMKLQKDGAFHNITVIRDVFCVHGAYATYGYVLANADPSNGSYNSYIPPVTASFTGTSGILTSQLETGPGRTGWTFLDGAFVANPYTTAHPRGTHLLNVKSERTDGYLSGFYNNQDYQNRQGGDYLNEVLVFTNELTVAERADVTRYLMQKWNIAPDAGDLNGSLEIADGAMARADVPADGSFPSLKLSGSGTFEKTGAGAFPLDADAFRGKVHVAGGTLTAQAFEDVGLALDAGEAVTATHGFEGSSVAVAPSAGAGKVTFAGANHVRVQEIGEGVRNLHVTSGTLVLAAPRAASFGTLPPGYDPVVTNADFEWNSGRNSTFADDVELYGWWRHGGVGGNIWKLDPGYYPFGKLQYMAADSTWFLNIQGDDSYHYTRVRIDRAGYYEFSFDCAARENYDRYLLTVKVGPSLDNLTDLAVFKTQRLGAFVRAAFRTPYVEPGTYLIGIRADTTNGMGSQAGGALFDNMRFDFVSETKDPDVWQIPNGDFEKLIQVASVNGGDSKMRYDNTAVGWTFDNGAFANAGTDPYAGVALHGMLNTSGRMIYSPRPDARGMTELFLAASSTESGAARVTFRPPAGTWRLRGDVSSCPLYFQGDYHWNHTYAYLTAKVTAGGATTDLGTAYHTTFVMASHTWPTAFTADGATDYTLELRLTDPDATRLPYSSCLADNFELVRVDRTASDYEFVQDGSFEETQQANYNQPMTGTGWRTEMNNVGQKFSYAFASPYTRFDTQIGLTKHDGNRVVILCGSAYIEQDLSLDAGDFEFSMWTGTRYDSTSGNSTNLGENPLKVYVYPTGGTFEHDAVEIGSFKCVTRAFTKRVALFHVPVAGSYTLRIQGQVTEPNSDRIARIDGVSVKRARLAAATPAVPKTLEVVVDAGAKLRLDYPGTNEVDRVMLGSAPAAGIISAETYPQYVMGPGALYVRPKGTALIFR